MYKDWYTLEEHFNKDLDKNELVHNGCQVPSVRPLRCNANTLTGHAGDTTKQKAMYLKVERNIEGYNLLTGVNSAEELMEIRLAIKSCLESWNDEKDKDGLINEELDFKVNLTTDFYDWESAKPSDGCITMNCDPQLKAGGLQRWWPTGRGHGRAHDGQILVTINQAEHLAIEWKVSNRSFKTNFHRFFKQLNILNKELKRKGLGGFWKEPDMGYISVDPRRCGTLFSCYVELQLELIPNNFSEDHIDSECREHLGITCTYANGKTPGGRKKIYLLKPANPTWLTEDQQFDLLLKAMNVLLCLERGICYNSIHKGVDSLFNQTYFSLAPSTIPRKTNPER